MYRLKFTQVVNPATSNTSATDKRWVLFRTAEHWIYPFHCGVNFLPPISLNTCLFFFTYFCVYAHNVDVV